MKMQKMSCLLFSTLMLAFAATGCAARTASDPAVAQSGMHQQGDPTLPNKVVDLRTATVFNHASGSASANEHHDAMPEAQR